MWFRVVELAYGRGMLPARKYRLARFLSQQELDPATGRVVGQWGTGRTDGGMTLAARYAWQFGVGEDRFWDDLKGLYAYGFAARVVAPAPGRRAVYALVLRSDAIPHDLPDDLARQLRVWDLPEFEDPHEDARYGHLTSDAEAAVLSGEPAVVPVDEAGAAELDAAPRWEHPADSPAAAAAEAIRSSAKILGKEAGPRDLRCWAVADRDRAEALNQRLTSNGKTSPLYARALSPLSGLLSTGSTWLSSANIEETKRTPSAAPTRGTRIPSGDDRGAVAERVQRRAWAAWRAQLGYGKVILRDGAREGDSRSLTGSAWSDLHRTIMIALRRSTESELVELLSANVGEADDLGRLAGWRLWRLINSRRDAHEHAVRRRVAQARHVTAWDEPDEAERDRRIAAGQAAQDAIAARQRGLAEAVEEQRRWRTELSGRWSLGRWAHEPQDETQDRDREDIPEAEQDPRARAEAEHAAALARARAEKRNRRRK